MAALARWLLALGGGAAWAWCFAPEPLVLVPWVALAPLLVLWLGYGMSSKVAMAVLLIYFPVTAAYS